MQVHQTASEIALQHLVTLLNYGGLRLFGHLRWEGECLELSDGFREWAQDENTSLRFHERYLYLLNPCVAKTSF